MKQDALRLAASVTDPALKLNLLREYLQACALLTRPFQKGRDWYDLLWYLARVPPVQPNPVLLSNALAQPGDVNLYRPDLGWKGSLRSILDTLDSGALRDDVAVFLEHPRDADLLTAEYFRQLLN